MWKHKGELIKNVVSNIKIDHNSKGLGTIMFMQTVLVCKLMVEYKLSEGPEFKIPAAAGQVRVRCNGGSAVARA